MQFLGKSAAPTAVALRHASVHLLASQKLRSRKSPDFHRQIALEALPDLGGSILSDQITIISTGKSSI
jgi:hypothetical protein